MARTPSASLCACALLLAWTAQAQQQLLVNLLPADSPALHRQFLYFQVSFSEWLTTRTAGKPTAEAADLTRKAAAVFGMKEADHKQMETISSAIGRELRAIDQEQIVHINGRARYEQHPVPSVLRQLETRREEAVIRGMAQLQRTLPPDAWNALRSYINGTYRNGIRVK